MRVDPGAVNAHLDLGAAIVHCADFVLISSTVILLIYTPSEDTEIS